MPTNITATKNDIALLDAKIGVSATTYAAMTTHIAANPTVTENPYGIRKYFVKNDTVNNDGSSSEYLYGLDVNGNPLLQQYLTI